MKASFKYLLLFVPSSFLICVSSSHALEPQIQLIGRKDLVLSVENRDTVLEVGQSFLTKPDGDFLATVENIEMPFKFEEEEVQIVGNKDDDSEKVIAPEPINYDDASVLAASAANFAKQVRGALARGDKSYIQLEGGSLLKPGTSFPVRLPQLKGQTFVMTVTEINSEGYTLQLGEATLQLNYDNSSPNPGSVEFTKP